MLGGAAAVWVLACDYWFTGNRLEVRLAVTTSNRTTRNLDSFGSLRESTAIEMCELRTSTKFVYNQSKDW